ncbi:MAG: cell division protein FtsQ/DivIB [Pseudomonadota bacterium]|nr:cell division protein FtsQ/DivIB [Pseudomonadota bacterium]
MPRSTRLYLRGISIVGILALVFGGPAWLSQSGWAGNAMHMVWQSVADRMAHAGLRVEEVILQGRRHESTYLINHALRLDRGTPILMVDLQLARERLEKLPWVRVASVERHYPSTIRVKIVERRPMALWQRENKLVLVDMYGTVITPLKLERFRDLLVIVGKDAPIHAASLMSVLANEPWLKNRVNAAVRVGNRRWNIVMDNGVNVRLPEKNPEAAWRRFAGLEREHKLLQQDLLSIDLRIPDQMIVRTRGNRPAVNTTTNHRKGKNT